MAKVAKKEKIELSQIEQAYLSLCDQIQNLSIQKDFLRDQIIGQFEEKNIEKDELLQLVTQERLTADDYAMRIALSASSWNKIKKEIVDITKLKAAFKVGEIDELSLGDAVKRSTIKVLRRV